MPPFKDEHVFIIAPGSLFTQTQYGLPETFTPPRWRFPTRMFPGLDEGQWEPVYVGERVRPNVPQPNGHSASETAPQPTSNDVEMNNGGGTSQIQAEGGSASDNPSSNTDDVVKSAEDQIDVTTIPEEEETEYFDDPYIEATAVYPLKSGRIENWSCFFAFLAHIYRMMNPNFQTPVMVVSQPCWTARDKEIITQYFFETFSIPAITVLDSALAAAWGFGVPSACVVDVGLDKCDVTAITDYVVNDVGRGVAIEGCGGSALTARLREELEKQEGKYTSIDDLTVLAEQLKKSPICEILPSSVLLPGQSTGASVPTNPLVAASTGLVSKDAGASHQNPAGATSAGSVHEEEENDGLLDVAAIVAQSNAAEIIAKREREKAEKDAKKKAMPAEGPKQIRLRNSERHKASFIFEELVPAEPTGTNAAVSKKRKREIEVGPERFSCAAPSSTSIDGVLDRIAGAVHSTIMAVPEVSARSSLWDNLIILGNGSRVRGFSNALVEVLSTRYTLSPSNATIFTSELPSNFSTPVPTGGTNTPIPGQGNHPGSHVSGSGVNPLLVAATKNMMQPAAQQQHHHHLQVPGQPSMPPTQLHGSAFPGAGMEALQHHSYRGISQSPTSQPKMVKPPEYFPEWKDPSVSGMEEASFLGAQVAAKVVFIVDQGVSKGFLTRSEYNEMGPEGIHSCAM